MTGAFETPGLSVVRGAPLIEEIGIGSLTLGGYIRELTSRYGSSEAAVIHLPNGIERWTYAELWSKSVEVARALIASGVGKGSRVGLLITNRLEFLSTFFGVALAGGVASPISTFFTATEIDEVLKTSGISMLLLERTVLKKDFAAMLHELEPELKNTESAELLSERYPFLRHVAAVDMDEDSGAIKGWSAFLSRGKYIPIGIVENISEQTAPSDPGVLFFSSGSTGKAKGILSSHRGVCLQLWRWKIWYAIEEPPRTWSANGFFFSGNFSMALGSTLSSGGSLLLQRYFHAEDALLLMEKESATMLLAWPHQWALLEAAPNYAATNLATLRYVDKDWPIAKHPTVKSNWQEPKQAYGCTETFTLITVLPVAEQTESNANSHGYPTPGSIVKIVDPITGEVVPVGTRGEIVVKGATLMLGYIGIPLDETLDKDGFYCTNDGGYIDQDGDLHWEGRLNDIIKTGGANVSPLEIDAVIRKCPGVKLNQTVGVADTLLGEIVVTCVVQHQGENLNEKGIQDFAKSELASYKVPRRVIFLSEDEMKTTGSAKIKTADLRAIAKKALERKQ